jgi:hypothetical protein
MWETSLKIHSMLMQPRELVVFGDSVKMRNETVRIGYFKIRSGIYQLTPSQNRLNCMRTDRYATLAMTTTKKALRVIDCGFAAINHPLIL